MTNPDAFFIDCGLGLARDNKVRLLKYNSNWEKVYQFESKRILKKVQLDTLKLHHCGSTSIPGIVSKPILDIVGEVQSLSEVDERKILFEKLGYVYKDEYGIKGRRYCVLYNNDKTISFCHLHIFISGSNEFQKYLIFRDFLRKNSEASQKYERVKKS